LADLASPQNNREWPKPGGKAGVPDRVDTLDLRLDGKFA
jgi:hypothetical protein